MNPYLSIVLTRVKMLLQYRVAALAGISTQLFWGLIRVMIFGAFYEKSGNQTLTFSECVIYIWLGQAIFAMFPWYPDHEIQAMVRSGNIAYELSRPIDLYWFWFFRAFATRAAPTLLRSFPIFLIAGLFFGLKIPSDFSHLLGWLIATLGGLALSASISAILSISVLFTLNGDGVTKLFPAVAYIFSGMIVPLPLFPESWQLFLKALPFSAFLDAPFKIYIGKVSNDEFLSILAHQAAWVLFFVFTGKFLLNRAVRRITVQGG
ncbi:ABC-2 family transporter protein [bacterium]|nr:ABC-2 family transporter protein [bacterium]